MGEQMIISISREYGSGGREIATRIAEDYSISLYDRNILEEISRQKNVDAGTLKPYDEMPRNVLTSRSVRGHNNSLEDNIANMQFEFIRQKAESGESFVILGRCSETVLADYPGVISFFILGDLDMRRKRIMECFQLSEKEATAKISRHDKYRKRYHNTYSSMKWGDSRNYELCINSSSIGIDGTVKVIETMIELHRH